MKSTGLLLPGLLSLAFLTFPASAEAQKSSRPATEPAPSYPPGYPPGTGTPPPGHPPPPAQPAPPPAPPPTQSPQVPASPPPPVTAAPLPPPPAANPTAVDDRRPAEAPTVGERHQGFYLRLMAGYAYTNASTDFPIGDTGGPQFHLAMGYSVVENLTVFIQLKESQFRAAGAGVVYHLMPVNAFAGVAGSVGNLSIRRRPEAGNVSSSPGPVVSLFLGKAWWVSESWGLGLALDGDWGQVTWKDVAPFDQPHTVRAFSLGVAGVATFN